MITKELVAKYRHIFHTDYTQDADCKMALLMDIDEDPLTDSSGNGNTGALLGAGEPNFATASPPDTYSTGYYVFDGVNDNVTVTAGDASDFDPSGGLFSIVSWINDTSSNGDGNHFYANADGSGGDRYEFLTTDAADNVRFSFSVDGGDNTSTADSGVDIRGDGWHHCVGVRSATHTALIYIDGVLEDTDTNVVGASGIEITSDFLIGSRVAGTDPHEGDLDEVAYFSRALDITEINDIMDNGLEGSAPPATVGIRRPHYKGRW